MQMTSRVEIVVLNWNGWKDTIACLSSLLKQDYPNFNIVVVDNDSSDESTEKIAQSMPSVELIQSGSNLGFGGGCNVGMRAAMSRGADYVWLINSDATADPSALSALVEVANAAPALGSVGSVLFEADTVDSVQLWGGGQVRLWTGQCHHQRAPAALDFISGASVLLRCDALRMVGLFDESTFFMYWEDTDLAFRLREAGWGLAVASQSRVWHKLSASVGQGSPLLDRYFTRSGVRFLRRYAPFPFVSVSLMLGRMLLKRIMMGNVERVRAVIDGFRHA
jgi:GT2 family glycosyltransferase